MVRFRNVPGATAAVGAFALTVMLGLGGASASALWQQNATATMTARAAANWPGPPLTSLTCTNDAPEKVATLKVTLPTGPANISYAAVHTDGSLGPSYQGPLSLLGLTPGSIVLTASPDAQKSQILKDNPTAGQLTVRVTAIYLDQTASSLDITLTNSPSKGKIICPVAPVTTRG